jgi:nucleoside recognition membrane protein YjiH
MYGKGCVLILENNRASIPKFIFFSLLGIVLFFIPVTNNEVPIVSIVNLLQKTLGVGLNYLVLFSCTLLVITFILAKVFKIERFQEYHKDDGPAIGVIYILAVIFDVMVLTNKGPAAVIDPGIGGLAVSLAGSVLLTVTVAGWLVVFIMHAGTIDFIGTLMEPIMRPVFRVPGEAAVDGIASFVSAPAVGVYLTSQLYEQSVYTEQEATAIITNFSVCSLGFFGVLVSVANVVDLYPQVVLTSFIITFILAAIVIRIPPISKKKTVYANGKVQNIHEKKEDEFKGNLISKAFALALKTASGLTIKTVYIALWEALKFAQKIVAYVITIATVTMLITHYTSLFTWLGKPMIPLLQLLGMPNVAEIAPSTIVGIAEIALPVMLLAGKDIALQSVFFIIVLSTVQIIFFTESAQAMLQSGIPVTALDLVIIFLERTIIAMPMVALAAHLLF